MGISVSDVVTSTPSVWGAANAATAAVVYPIAAIAAAAQVVRSLIGGMAKLNGVAAAILGRLAADLGGAKAVLGTLGAAGGVLGGYYIGDRAVPSFKETQTTLNWPKQLPAGTALPAGYRAPSAADKDAIKKIDPASIKALGKDLDAGAAHTLGAAYEEACGNDVGYPGFGVVGLHLAHAHSVMRDHAAQQLAASRDTPGTWLPGLRTSADNWVFAEQANVKSTRHDR